MSGLSASFGAGVDAGSGGGVGNAVGISIDLPHETLSSNAKVNNEIVWYFIYWPVGPSRLLSQFSLLIETTVFADPYLDGRIIVLFAGLYRPGTLSRESKAARAA